MAHKVVSNKKQKFSIINYTGKHKKHKNTKGFRTRVSSTPNDYPVKTHTSNNNKKYLPQPRSSLNSFLFLLDILSIAQIKTKYFNSSISSSSSLPIPNWLLILNRLNLSEIYSQSALPLKPSPHRSTWLHPLHSCILHIADTCLSKRKALPVTKSSTGGSRAKTVVLNQLGSLLKIQIKKKKENADIPGALHGIFIA